MVSVEHAHVSLPDVFSTSSADALGLSSADLRRRRFRAPRYGVRTTLPPLRDPSFERQRVIASAREFAPRLRDGEAFSHTTALHAFGCPLRRVPEVHVSAQPGFQRCRAAGIAGHESVQPFETRIAEGLPVVPPDRALLQASARIGTRELIVAIDHLICPRGLGSARRSLMPLADVAEAAGQYRGRGVRGLRAALALARPGAESRFETLTRLILVAFGLDAYFELQGEVVVGGEVIGRFDLVCRERKVIVEYDGQQHRTDDVQYRKDLYRLEEVRMAGYTVVRLLAEDVLHFPHSTARRIAAALGVGLAIREQYAYLLG